MSSSPLNINDFENVRSLVDLANAEGRRRVQADMRRITEGNAEDEELVSILKRWREEPTSREILVNLLVRQICSIKRDLLIMSIRGSWTGRRK